MTNTAEATLIDRDGCPTLCFERRLRAPLERVWQAVTDEDEMRSWFPGSVLGERKVGAPLQFRNDVSVPEGWEGTVSEWNPMKVFAFDWNGDDIRIELTPEGDETHLQFTHVLNHLSAAARTGAGWHACLANLDAHLLGATASAEVWRDEYPVYLELMGPPPATFTRQCALTFERSHFVTVDRMWECLTDPKELEAWMGYGSVAIDLRLGGTVRFFDDPNPEAGVIVALDPLRRIAYTWGESLAVVDWQLEPTEHGTKYRLTKHGMPEDRAGGWAAGWHSFLLQLDMYAASGQLVIDEHEPRIPGYEALVRAV